MDNIEYEIKILDVDIDAFRKKLNVFGAELKGKYNFRRYIFELANKKEWIRLRTDGKFTTLTYKHAINDEIDGVKEIEVEVSSFEDTKTILENSGLKASNYQENTREEYIFKNASVTIDNWPGIPSYIEIEADSKEQVEILLHELELADHKTTSKTVADIYAYYDVKMP